MLYKVILTFNSVDEILKCDLSSEKILSSTFMWRCLFVNILRNKLFFKTQARLELVLELVFLTLAYSVGVNFSKNRIAICANAEKHCERGP